MLEAGKIAFSKLRKRFPLFASLVVFSIVVSIARGMTFVAALGRLIPVFLFAFVFFAYQMIKANRSLTGKPRLSRGQLFSRFYAAVFVLFVSYFGLSILWEMKGNGGEAFGMFLPVFLFCVVLCAVALYREIGDLPDDFEGG
ncbi:hypothetical protein AB4Y36_12270 [Paraburkholderia sp. BR10936]|uniref:hypothetical protein n=1 Tax=Paraburkholderia sp. BR10936 TaxID=3236993 RepID=UPI0034D2234E